MAVEIAFDRKDLASQVTEHLRKSISYGLLNSTDFPNSRLLAKKYGVSHNVMLKVLRKLREEEVLHLTSKRRGYEVNNQQLMS